MSIIMPNEPISYKKKLKPEPYLYKNKIVYPINKYIITSFNTNEIIDEYYEVFYIIYSYKTKKIKLLKNKFRLYSPDFYSTYYPEGELITNKDLIKTNINILKTKSLIKIIQNKNLENKFIKKIKKLFKKNKKIKILY